VSVDKYWNGTDTVTLTTSNTSVNNFSYSITFEKDGTYHFISEESDPNSDAKTTVEQTGTWTFLGASETLDLKKKEAITLMVTSYLRTERGSDGSVFQTVTYAEAEDWENSLLYIDRLQNKELIIKYKVEAEEDGNIDSYDVDKTYKKK